MIVKSSEVELTEVPVVVPAGPVVITVTGHVDRSILVDGVPKRLTAGTQGMVALDYTRSTGYHRVHVDGCVFWFATEDRKLRLEGITRMLDELRGLGTAWSGQALFSDGSGYLDPHVVYGWLDANAERALDAIETVLAAPRSENVSARILSRRGGNSVLAVPTMRFIRRIRDSCCIRAITVDRYC